MSKPLTTEQEDGIIAAYLAGASAEKAAAQFGYTGATCLQVLRRRGIQLRNKSEARQIPKEHQEAMIAAYLAGATTREAAAQFGYSPPTCVNVLLRYGLKPRTPIENGKKIPPEIEDAIVETYLAGASLEEAASRFGHSSTSCRNILVRRGITPRNLAIANNRVPEEIENKIIAAYQAGTSIEQIAAGLGCSTSACYIVMKRREIKLRTHSEANRRYNVDESFFDQIDTEEKAYWLGFLTADGHINNIRNMITIDLKVSDRTHLEKFAAALKSSHLITYRECKLNGKLFPQAGIQVNSPRLVSALKKLGVGPKKSFTVQPCKSVPEIFLSAYWRGIFDGDGCICYPNNNKGKKRIWNVSLVGNEFIVSGFQQYVTQFVVSKAQIHCRGKTCSILYGGSDLPRSIVKVLYHDATVYLDRKYVLAQDLIGL